jgi:Zn-dependent metalloprotease/uncharacterized protein (DUF486 family)
MKERQTRLQAPRGAAVFYWVLVLLVVFMAVVWGPSIVSKAQTTSPARIQSSDGVKTLIKRSAGSVVTSSSEEPNPQTISDLSSFLQNYQGTWKVDIQNGVVKNINPTSPILVTSPKDFSLGFLAEFSNIFGIRSSEAAYLLEFNLRDKRVVEYRQEIDGVPVEYSFITFAVKDSQLEQITSRLYPEVSQQFNSVSPSLTKQAAFDIADSDFEKNLISGISSKTNHNGELVILPEGGDYFLTWKIVVDAPGTLESYTYYVDANRGQIITKYSNLKSQKAKSPSAGNAESKEEASAVLDRVVNYPKSNSGTIESIITDKNGRPIPEAKTQSGNIAEAWQFVLSENFDVLAFPYSPWSVFDSNGSTGGQLFWDDQNCVYNDPNWSLWAAAGGTNRLNACTDSYTNNMASWVTYGPFSMSNTSDGLLDFHYRNESEAGFDYFSWLASVDGTNFYGYKVSGNSNGWQYQSLDLKNVPTLGNITGRSQVWIAFLFTSDGSVISGKGPFVDDVAIQKMVSSSCSGVSGHVGGHIYGKNQYDLQLKDFKDMKVVLNKSFATDSYALTNSVGNYSSSECSDYIRFELEGYGSSNFLKVRDCNDGNCPLGGDLLTSQDFAFASQVNFDWNVDAENKKEVNVFWHVNEMHDWYRGLLGQDFMNYQMQAYVDYVDLFQQDCSVGKIQAFYRDSDKNIYFCPSDVSRESDVIYHEYTHGVVHHIPNYSLPYQDESGAMDESFADYYAAVKNNDPVIGEGVGTIRTITDVVNFSDKCNRQGGSCGTTQYWTRSTSPADSNDYGYVHHNSLVASGSLWNLRQNQGLSGSYVDKLVLDTLILRKPLTFAELLNGLIGQDGGSHENQIRAAFATRGIGSGLPILTSSLVLSPGGTHTIGQTITGSFSITNRSTSTVSLQALTIGGRLNGDNTVRDFPAHTNITINPSETKTYQDTFFISEAGDYRFFPAYKTSDGTWRIGLLHEIPKDSGVIDLVSFSVAGSSLLAPPALVSPGTTTAPGSSIATLTPTFSWQSVTGADGYGLYVSRYNGSSYDLVFDSQVDVGQPLGGNSYVLPAGRLQDGGEYRWNMSSHNSAGYGTPNTTRNYFYVTLPTQTYTISVSASPAGAGTVTGNGSFAAGSSRTVTATAAGGYTFVNWKENGSIVSSSASYTFTLNSNRTLVANFSLACAAAQMTNPTNGASLPSSTTFTWNTGTGNAEYWLQLGTTVGGSNIYSASQLTGTSRTLSNLPSGPIYVRLSSRCAATNTWSFNDYSYTGPTSCAAAQMTNPTNGASLLSSTTFSWNTGTGNAEYWLQVGTTVGGSNIYSASQLAGTSRTLSNLPSGPIYVRLSSRCSGTNTWSSNDYSYTGPASCAAAQMTNPTNGASLLSNTTFTWNTGTGNAEYWLQVGTTVGGSNIYSASQLAGTSRTLSNLPSGPIYVRLSSRCSGTNAWSFNDYSYTGPAASCAAAQITSPTNGASIPSSTIFTWNTGTGNAEYWLQVGTTVGGGNIYSASQLTGTSRTLSNLPSGPIYVRLSSRCAATNAWTFNDYSYTGPSASCASAQMTNPANGASIPSSAAFNWNTGTGNAEYWLQVGTTVGGGNIYSASQLTGTSRTVSNLPGGNIYVRLSSRCSATNVWSFNDYSYVVNDPRSQMLSPAGGAFLPSSNVTFTWTRGTGVSQNFLYVGNTPGSSEYFYDYITNGSTNVSGIPIDGRTIYVRLWSLPASGWTYLDYSYTACLNCGSNQLARITSPLNGTTFSSSAVTFNWDVGTGNSQYFLYVGNSQGSSEYLYSSISGGSSTVSGLPTDGRAIWVRIWSYNGQWLYLDYVYKATG